MTAICFPAFWTKCPFYSPCLSITHWVYGNQVTSLRCLQIFTSRGAWGASSTPGSSLHGIFKASSTGVGCHFLLQGIFPTQGLNPGLSHCRQTLYPLSHQGSPISRGAWRASSIPGSDLDNKMLNYEPDAMMRWDFDDLRIGEGILHIEWIYVIWVWNKESQTLLIILPMNMWSLIPSYLNLSWSCDNLTNRL